MAVSSVEVANFSPPPSPDTELIGDIINHHDYFIYPKVHLRTLFLLLFLLWVRV